MYFFQKNKRNILNFLVFYGKIMNNLFYYFKQTLNFVNMKGFNRKMTVKEFYDNIHSDYSDILTRLPNDELILYFVSKFPSDNSYSELIEAVKNNDIILSFESAHKLKGVTANLSFTPLFDALKDLCEQLRPLTTQADKRLLKRVSDNYNLILKEINSLCCDDTSK